MTFPNIKLILSLLLSSPLISHAAYIDNPIEKDNNNFNTPLSTSYAPLSPSFLQQPLLNITGTPHRPFQKVASDSLPFDFNYDDILNETILLENSETFSNLASQEDQGQVPASFWLLGIGLIGLAKVKQTHSK